MLCLPHEILMHVISYLRIHEVENLAQTFNTDITPVCLDVLSDWLLIARNELMMTRLCAITGIMRVSMHACVEELFSITTIGQLGLIYSPPPDLPTSQLRVLEYLDLKGNFRWLRPFESSAFQSLRLFPQAQAAATAQGMSTFENTTRGLGLAMPQGFKHFMTSLDLQLRFLSPPDPVKYYFVLQPLFIIQSSIHVQTSDGHRAAIDGYACKIHTGEWVDEDPAEFYWNWYLYMDSHGGHCVLSSELDLLGVHDDVEDKPPYARRPTLREQEFGVVECCELGRDPAFAGMVHLQAISFEEFLVHTYFGDWVRAALDDDCDVSVSTLPVHVREFLFRVYTNKGRDQWP